MHKKLCGKEERGSCTCTTLSAGKHLGKKVIPSLWKSWLQLIRSYFTDIDPVLHCQCYVKYITVVMNYKKLNCCYLWLL
jgi:hypothetical protein